MEHTLEFRLLGSRDSGGGGGVGELDMVWWGGRRTDGGSTTDGAAERGAHGAAAAISADTQKKPGCTNITEHSIETGDSAAIRLPPYRLPHAYRELACGDEEARYHRTRNQ